jgi:hypothetical protein
MFQAGNDAVARIISSLFLPSVSFAASGWLGTKWRLAEMFLWPFEATAHEIVTGLLGARHSRINASTTTGVATLLAAGTCHGTAFSATANDDIAAPGVTTVVEKGGRGDARRRLQTLLGGGITTATGTRINALDGRAGEPPTGDPLFDASSNVLEKKRGKGDPQRGWRFHCRKSGGACNRMAVLWNEAVVVRDFAFVLHNDSLSATTRQRPAFKHWCHSAFACT